MSTSDQKKTCKLKRPKHKINPGTSTSTVSTSDVESTCKPSAPLCPLLAKDSEWVDIVQTSATDVEKLSSNVSDEEGVLQLVECEDGPQIKPLAIMFPGLLEKDPQTLQGILNKAMSTTEVTRYLVGLGQKANFTFMKKADRLIPTDKQWLESLTENSNSYCSAGSGFFSGSISSDYGLDDDVAEGEKINFSKVNTKDSFSHSRRNKHYEDTSVIVRQIISDIVQEVLCRVDSVMK